MSDIGIQFSWGYIGAVIIGAIMGFVVGEALERALRNVRARRGRELSSKVPKPDLIRQRISQTVMNPK